MTTSHHILELLSAAASMMTLRRREDDDGGPDDSIARLAKQMAPLVGVSLLTVGGMQFSPIGADVMGGRKEIQDIVVKVERVSADVAHVTERINEISARRTQQVADLERRILSCELTIAEHGAKKK